MVSTTQLTSVFRLFALRHNHLMVSPNDMTALLGLRFFDDAPPPTTDLKKAFINALWPSSPENAGKVDFEAYFHLLREERRRARPEQHAISTYEDIISIIDIVRANLQLPPSEVLDLVKATRGADPSTSKTAASIALGLRLWLMFDVHDCLPQNRSLPHFIPWVENPSLESVITRQSTWSPHSRPGRFQENMNVWNMYRMVGFQIKWTNNLNLHLVLEGSTIYFFHNASVLKLMKTLPNFPLPHRYLDETIATIDLLLPLDQRKCNKWLRGQVDALGLDQDIIHRRAPNFDRSYYVYWHARLIDIEHAFETARPRSLVQWMYDTRNWERWWTFWLVVAGVSLTVIFGLIQSVAGIIQVVRPK
ncbi:hypothetical protein GGR57DRAFT_477013 [Xylariaceae sp. FL1272]|nr:hypothetical protein GGR57DRAFT_477013 [Xylariaceae sp. FL1272]